MRRHPKAKTISIRIASGECNEGNVTKMPNGGFSVLKQTGMLNMISDHSELYDTQIYLYQCLSVSLPLFLLFSLANIADPKHIVERSSQLLYAIS